MDIQLEKIELIKKIANTNDVAVLDAIKSVFASPKTDFWNELSSEQQLVIEQSIDEYHKNSYSSFDEFISKCL